MTTEKQQTVAVEINGAKPGGRVGVREGSRRIVRSAWTIAVLVLLAYGGFLFASYHNGRDARYFIKIGTHYVLQSHTSLVIKLAPRCRCVVNESGYDGQFNYYMALDPVNARYYMDVPAYRYGRILFPMTARLLALGQPDVVPYTLILINWLALAGGTLGLASALLSPLWRARPPWYLPSSTGWGHCSTGAW
jgi:hypothetical protein